MQDLVEGVKRCDAEDIETAAHWILRGFPKLERFNGPLVPIPRSTKGLGGDTNIELAEALLDLGIGTGLLLAIERTETVPSQRIARREGLEPDPDDQLRTLRVATRGSLPREVMLVDDVVTEGNTLLAAAWHLGALGTHARGVVVARAIEPGFELPDAYDPLCETFG